MKLFQILFRSSLLLTSIAIVVSLIDAIASIGLISTIQHILNSTKATNQTLMLFAGLCVVVLVAKIISQLLLTRIAERSISDVLMTLCNRITNLELRDFEKIGSHRALSAVTNDVGTVATTIQGIPVLIGNSFALLFGLIYLGMLSVKVLIGAILFIAFGFMSYRWTAAYAKTYLTQAREHQDTLTKNLRDMIEGIKELRMHRDRLSAFLNDAIASTNAAVRTNQTIGYSIQGAAVSWGRLVFFLAIGTLLFWSQVDAGLDRNTLTAATLVILFLMTPVERIIAWLPLLTRSNIAVKKIQAFGDLESAGMVDSIDCPTAFQSLELRDIRYCYEHETDERGFTFGPIDFHLEPEEIVFIVGGNGSGKTTFLKLLTGLYRPDSGAIALDSKMITDDNRDRYRQMFSVVFAEPVLFNNLHGLNVGDAQLVFELLVELELDSKVKITDGRISTIDLSKGQRKRLALLTAFLEDRPIYVFDEWAADQDPIYKRVFYDQILPSLRNRRKAVVVISHDDQYFAKADRIVHLADGQLANKNISADSHSVEPSIL
jgi:putative pyoverdin transport system ATP-binding/permease protein